MSFESGSYQRYAFKPAKSHLRHQTALASLQRELTGLRNGLNNLSISAHQAANRARQPSDLRRSNAVRRGNTVSKTVQREYAERSVSSSSSTSLCSGSDTISKEYEPRDTSVAPENREADKKLPEDLRCLVDQGYSCTAIGKYLVELTRERNSFYSGLIASLVNANKPYYEICVRVFRVLELKSASGHPLEREAHMGDITLRPERFNLIRRPSFDRPKDIAPSHTLCPVLGERQSWLFGDMSDEQIEEMFEPGEEEIGEAHSVDFSRYSVHVVDTLLPSGPRGEVLHLNDDSKLV
ncbi:hypothetical protein BDW62DRAFT_165605 [Aspergillus aurantiobrunneus]